MYIIHDVKYGTYLAHGTQRGRDGKLGPAWSTSKYDAVRFSSVAEAKAAMYRVKRIRNQDNRGVIYERV